MISAVLSHVERVQEWLGSWPDATPSRLRSWTESPPRTAPRADRNPDALASYLFGMLAALPLLGLLFGVAAVALGVRGLSHARDFPRSGGQLQSRIGIALGAVFATGYLAVSSFLVAVLLL